MNSISKGLATIFTTSMVSPLQFTVIWIYLLPVCSLWGFWLCFQKKKKSAERKHQVFLSLIQVTKWSLERKKSVAFKCYYLANDSSHRMTVLKLIRHSKHPQKSQRGFLVPQLCFCSLHMFSNIISCLLSDSSLNKGLLVHIVPIFLLRS